MQVIETPFIEPTPDIELSNLKQFDIVFKKKGIRSLDTLYCPKCGSNNVEERAWVNPNTDEISYNDSVEEEDCWCNICEEHVELCTLSELWEMFGDIPVNNDDEIEEDFLTSQPEHQSSMSGVGSMNGVSITCTMI